MYPRSAASLWLNFRECEKIREDSGGGGQLQLRRQVVVPVELLNATAEEALRAPKRVARGTHVSGLQLIGGAFHHCSRHAGFAQAVLPVALFVAAELQLVELDVVRLHVALTVQDNDFISEFLRAIHGESLSLMLERLGGEALTMGADLLECRSELTIHDALWVASLQLPKQLLVVLLVHEHPGTAHEPRVGFGSLGHVSGSFPRLIVYPTTDCS